MNKIFSVIIGCVRLVSLQPSSVETMQSSSHVVIQNTISYLKFTLGYIARFTFETFSASTAHLQSAKNR